MCCECKTPLITNLFETGANAYRIDKKAEVPPGSYWETVHGHINKNAKIQDLKIAEEENHWNVQDSSGFLAAALWAVV